MVDGEGNRLLHVRFTGEERRFEAGRQRHYLRRFLRRHAGVFENVGGRRFGRDFRRIEFVVELRPLGVEFEIVEVDMAPVTALFVHDADEDFFSGLILQINDDRPQCFAFIAGRFENHFLRVGAREFNARGWPRTARDEKARPRLRHFERHGSERAFRVVAAEYVFELFG